MTIASINVYRVNLPFKFTFSHARNSEKSAENILVEVVASDGDLRGYGEGAPRPLVTGETPEAAVRDVESLCLDWQFPWDLQGVTEIWEFVERSSAEKRYISSLCALEMAVLDLLGKKTGKNITDFLPKAHFTHEVRYGGTIPIADNKTVASICHVIKDLDITHIRLKVGKDLDQNRMMLDVLREVLNEGYELRADVNCGWDLKMTEDHLSLLESYRVEVLEQPMMPSDPNWGELKALLKGRGIKLMADESVFSLWDLEKIISEKHFDVVNVKLTKSPGFLISLGIIERIRDAGLTYQIGCQVGESGILSAAGRALCAVCSDALYCDGSYDTFLLGDNLTTEHLAFGDGGRGKVLEGPGLGIKVHEQNLRQFSSNPITIQKP